MSVSGVGYAVALVYLMAGIIIVPAVGFAALARAITISYADVARWIGWTGVAITVAAIIAGHA